MTQLPVFQFNSNQFSILKFLSSVIVLSPMIAWLLIALIGMVFIILSSVLAYHWKKFGIDTLVMGRAAILYFSVSAVLWVLMTSSLVVYLNSI